MSNVTNSVLCDHLVTGDCIHLHNAKNKRHELVYIRGMMPESGRTSINNWILKVEYCYTGQIYDMYYCAEKSNHRFVDV